MRMHGTRPSRVSRVSKVIRVSRVSRVIRVSTKCRWTALGQAGLPLVPGSTRHA
jgi:hypothetical protein